MLSISPDDLSMCGDETKIEAWLIYDGQCPFCKSYVTLIRLRENLNLQLIDAREGGALVEEVTSEGLDLNEGMILKYAGRYYHAHECLHVLAMLSTPVSGFNRINAALFRSSALSKLLYPMLRTLRNMFLWLLGRKKIDTGSK